MMKNLFKTGVAFATLLMCAINPHFAKADNIEVGSSFDGKASIYDVNFTVTSLNPPEVTANNMVTKSSGDGWVGGGGSGSANFGLPSTTTYDGVTYTITAIGDNFIGNHTVSGTLSAGDAAVTIGSKAYYGLNCSQIVIYSTTQTIGSQAFANCNKVTTVVCLATVPPATSSDNTDPDNVFSCYDNATLYVPDEVVDTYKSAEIWKNFSKVEPVSSFASNIYLSTYDMTLYVGQTGTVSAINASPSYCLPYVTLALTDGTDCVDFDASTGQITALAPGTATITATCGNATRTMTVTVNQQTFTVFNPWLFEMTQPMYNNSIDITFTPVSYMLINTVYLDGEDVTSQVNATTGELKIENVESDNAQIALSLAATTSPGVSANGKIMSKSNYNVYVKDNVLYIESSNGTTIDENTSVVMSNFYKNTILYKETYATAKDGIPAVDPGVYKVYVGGNTTGELGDDIAGPTNFTGTYSIYYVVFPDGNSN